jgi:plastocyanin
MKTLIHLSSYPAVLVLLVLFQSCTVKTENSVHALHTVEIRAMQFHPASLQLNENDTVLFINHDILVHDVTEETSKKWTSSPLASGQSYKMVIKESANYYCSIHPVMKGSLIVR